ncbi:MAG: S41 family peptidase [bacterium]
MKLSSGLLGLTLVALVWVSCQSGPPDVHLDSRFTLDQLQSDFDQYTDLIEKRHPGFFTDRAALARIAAKQRALLTDNLTLFEFYRILSPVRAEVRCGHTRLYLPERVEAELNRGGNLLPLAIGVFNDSLLVLANISPQPMPQPGDVVLAIDGITAQTIIEDLKTGLHADGENETYKYANINWDFTSLYRIFFPESGQKGQFVISALSAASGEQYTANLNVLRQQVPEPGPEADPDAPQPPPPNVIATFATDNRFAVLTIADFGFYDDFEAFQQPVDEFFYRLAHRKIDTVILDLRGNDGGDPYCGAHLLKHLLRRPFTYFGTGTQARGNLLKPQQPVARPFAGNLYVLIDGGCFSTTGHLCSLLRYHGIGFFIGEETGGSYACNDASRMHTLKNTGLQALVPNRTFRTAVQGLHRGRGIMPDLAVQPTITQVRNGRDVVLETAIATALNNQ